MKPLSLGDTISAINFHFFNHRRGLDLVYMFTGMMLPEIFDYGSMLRLKSSRPFLRGNTNL
jgi:hypothetical protein